jgi:hypothetical protein
MRFYSLQFRAPARPELGCAGLRTPGSIHTKAVDIELAYPIDRCFKDKALNLFDSSNS